MLGLVSFPVVTLMLLLETFGVGLITSGGIRGAVFNLTISWFLAMVSGGATGSKLSLTLGSDL